jgi:ribosomal protein L32
MTTTPTDAYAETGQPCELATVLDPMDEERCGPELTAQSFKLKKCPRCADECVSHRACLYHANEIETGGLVQYDIAPPAQ